MRSDAIEVEVCPARWPVGGPHNIQRYGPQRFRDCGEVRSKDWTVWPEPGAQPVRAGLDLSWLKGPGLCVARQTDITFETVRNRAVFCTGSNSRLRNRPLRIFCEYCQHPCQRTACGRSHVEGFGERDEADAQFRQFLQCND